MAVHIEMGLQGTSIPEGRNPEKITRRAKLIKKDVLKFEGFYNLIKGARNTGVNEVDEVVLAMASFKKESNSAFKYLEHWKYMIKKNILDEYLDIPVIPKTPDMVRSSKKRPAGKQQCVKSEIEEMLLKKLKARDESTRDVDMKSLNMMNAANGLASLMQTCSSLPSHEKSIFDKIIACSKKNLDKQLKQCIDLTVDTDDEDVVNNHVENHNSSSVTREKEEYSEEDEDPTVHYERQLFGFTQLESTPLANNDSEETCLPNSLDM